MKAWEKWLHGLGAAAIGGGATAITVMVVSPESFNLHEGLQKLLDATIVSGLVNSAFYLKRSPLPDMTDDSIVQQNEKIPPPPPPPAA